MNPNKIQIVYIDLTFKPFFSALVNFALSFLLLNSEILLNKAIYTVTQAIIPIVKILAHQSSNTVAEKVPANYYISILHRHLPTMCDHEKRNKCALTLLAKNSKSTKNRGRSSSCKLHFQQKSRQLFTTNVSRSLGFRGHLNTRGKLNAICNSKSYSLSRNLSDQ